jgi:predicted AlkP superfamily phosphohydrolase/phosphomutase
MTRPKVLVIGLDGWEISFAEELFAQGKLPTLARQRQQDAHLLLDHGSATRTGLAWEHFWSGLSPEAAHRNSPVEFDPTAYRAWQEGARFDPFFRGLDAKSVVFDTCYADISRTPEVEGVVCWGAHDPGLSGTISNPSELLDELLTRVGDYPSQEFTYASPWASVDTTEAMGKGLVAGVEARAAAARWLFGERITDWDLGVVVVAEPHSAAEGLWHGVDPTHPLAEHPSAPAAREALVATYEACDRLVADLVAATEPTVLVVFSMGGMGSNHSDVASMVLLPELVHRWATGEPVLTVPAEWAAAPTVPPSPTGARNWNPEWYGALGASAAATPPARRLVDALPTSARHWIRDRRSARRSEARAVGYRSLDWQPCSWYQPHWSGMRAFAVPSLYDGRIRVNLRGREADGMVDVSDYERVCDELEQLVRAVVDPATGDGVVAEVVRPASDDPLAAASGDVDLVVVWHGGACSWQHPEHGLIGPVPHRRTGGHTGPYGYASLSGPGIVGGEYGVVSAFDIAPTVVELLGGPEVDGLSGTSVVATISGYS